MAFYRLPPLDTESVRLVMSGDQLSHLRMAIPREVTLVAPGAIEFTVGDTGFLKGRPARGCLSTFTKLADASDREVVTFTRQWGVIGVCDHGLPGVHGVCAPRGAESVEVYHFWSRLFGAILRLSHAIDEGRTGEKSDWDTLGEGMFSAYVQEWEGREHKDTILRAYLSHYINYFLMWAHIVPIMYPQQGGYRLRLRIGGLGGASPSEFHWPEGSLYPVLVAQLIGALMQSGLSTCRYCEQLFSWQDAGYERLPRHDRGAYCSDECRDAARRQQKSDYKRRKARERREIGNG